MTGAIDMTSETPRQPRAASAQLTLELAPAPGFERDNFIISSSNEQAYAMIELWPGWPDPMLLILGPPGSGKSHLGTIWAAIAKAAIQPAASLAGADIDALASAGPLLLEDADAIGESEARLFHLVNLMRERDTALVMMAKKNIEVIPSDTLFKSMAQAIIASDDTIKHNPALIEKVVRATLKGMKDIMADPAAAAVDFVKATPELAGKEDFVTLSFQLYNKYVYGGQKVLGEMDEARLTALQDFYAKEGLIKSKTAVKDLYTNQFIK